MGVRLDVAVELAEEDIVGLHLADFQRMVPVHGIATSDDHLRHMLLDRLGKRGRIAGNVKTVGLGPASHPAVIGDKRCGPDVLDQRHEQFGMLLERRVIKTVLRNDDRGDVATFQGVADRTRLCLGIGNVGYDQDETAAIFGTGHDWIRSPGWCGVLRTPPSYWVSKSDRPVHRKDQPKQMNLDLLFYAAAIPAVILVGLSKGGLGGAFALIGVPLLAIVVPPMQAAAIFLPILLVMDAVALWAWRSHNSRPTLLAMLPGGILGIAIGWATSAYVSVNVMRLLLGSISVLFALRYFVDAARQLQKTEPAAAPERPVAATLWGTLSGYSSFVAHAGGPPFQIYTLPLRLDPLSYTGTSTRFFAIMNAIKVIPYFALGELGTGNLVLSATLLPLALVSTLIGARLVHHLKPHIFYPLMYGMVLIAGGKLLYDGITGL